jgi:hypothetical protein
MSSSGDYTAELSYGKDKMKLRVDIAEGITTRW